MSGTPKLVITDFITAPLDYERRVLGDAAEVSALEARSESDLDGRIEEAFDVDGLTASELAARAL